MLRAHPDYGRLEKALARSLETRALPWTGVAFRCAAEKYSGIDSLVSGRGAFRWGSRWMAPRVTPALHAATSPETAFAESLARFRRENIPEWQAMPLVVRGVEADLALVLDLTDGVIRRSIRVSEKRMIAAAWAADNAAGRESLSQAIGRAAFAAGFQGLLVPSAAVPRATTLVVFPENLDAASKLGAL